MEHSSWTFLLHAYSYENSTGESLSLLWRTPLEVKGLTLIIDFQRQSLKIRH